MEDKNKLVIGIVIAISFLVSGTFIGTSFVNGETFEFASAGDYSCNSNAKAVINQMKLSNPDAIWWLGDYSYNDDNVNCWIDQTKNLPPNIGVIGNHEDPEDGSQAARDQIMKHFKMNGTGYFAINYKSGKVLVVGMDSQKSMSPTTAQYKFVKNALETSDAPLKIVLVHKPFLTCKCSHSMSENGQYNNYHPLFLKTGVDMVLQAHNHNNQIYEVDGIIYGVFGGGGRSHYDLTTTPKPTIYKDENKYGFFSGTADFDTGKLNGMIITSTGQQVEQSKFEMTFANVTLPPEPPTPTEEVCGDNIDNDLDGQVDENCINEVVQCVEPNNTTCVLPQNLTITLTNQTDLPVLEITNQTFAIKPTLNNTELVIITDRNTTRIK